MSTADETPGAVRGDSRKNQLHLSLLGLTSGCLDHVSVQFQKRVREVAKKAVNKAAATRDWLSNNTGKVGSMTQAKLAEDASKATKLNISAAEIAQGLKKLGLSKSRKASAGGGQVSIADAVKQLVRLRDLVDELGGAEYVREAIETTNRFSALVGSGNEIEALNSLDQLG